MVFTVCAEVPDDPNRVGPGPAIDVVFLLDSTGSMSDEILAVKGHIQNIVEETMSGNPRPAVRVGIVTYRDHPPQDSSYVYKKFDLTDEIDDVMVFLRDIEAQGGGDGPEAVADGLNAAVNKMDWSDDSQKIIFLIGDAPPHGLEGNSDNSFQQGCPDGHDYLKAAESAARKDITIHTIGCSGIDDYTHGVDVFRKIASITGGKYKPLEYKRVVAKEYYISEEVAHEYADTALDSTYDPASGTILISDLNRFAGGAMKSAAMEAGVSYDDTTETEHKEEHVQTVPYLPTIAVLIGLGASGVLISRR